MAERKEIQQCSWAHLSRACRIALASPAASKAKKATRAHENDPDWIIAIPASAFLYKVAKGRRVQENGELAIMYVTDEIVGGEVQNFTINLQKLRNTYDDLSDEEGSESDELMQT